MGDCSVQVASQPGRGVGFTGQPKIPDLGLEAMWIDGARREHDVAARQVL